MVNMICPDWRMCSYCEHRVEHQVKDRCIHGKDLRVLDKWESIRPLDCTACVVAVKGYLDKVDVYAGKRSIGLELKDFVKEYVKVYKVALGSDILVKLLELDDKKREYEIEWLINTGYLSEYYYLEILKC